MSFIKKQSSLLCIICMIAVVPFMGCIERNIEGFEENAGLYSVYGSLNADSDFHYVRVKDAQMPAIPDSSNPFDGTVIFEDLEEGTETLLNRTEMKISDYYVNNFALIETLTPGKSYRLKVEGPEGKMVTTTTRVPEITEVSIEPGNIANCETMIEFTFKNVKYPEHVRMEVGFGRYRSEIGLVAQLEHRDDKDEMFVKMNIRNLLVEVAPPRSEVIISASDPRTLESPRFHCSRFDKFTIWYTHYGPEWDLFSPGFFPHDPLQWQDVENGLGFLGSFRRGSAIVEY